MIVIAVAVGLVVLGGSMENSEKNSSSSKEEASASDSSRLSKGTIAPFIKSKLPEGKKPNRLIKEKSPYLLQHAFNPVDWYPWGEEAFEKARREDKPIFLSIGYSTCYWCHVMEREVFENDSIAALMNQYLVSIKVDREERPDVDRVYMTALQAMTGSGGWPMSMFLTPELKPFFGATYIPPESKWGRPGFRDIITRIQELWTSNRQAVLENSQQIADYLRQAAGLKEPATKAGQLALDRGFESFSKSYDPNYGGFGNAPKFPRPVVFNFLLRYYKRTGESKALEMTLETLSRMARGGMHDQIGGGFHRYSTDEKWHLPHFEKMLYDQAQLAISYLEAFQITHDNFYADAARDVLAYVQRNLTHPEGGFYSAEDAESAVDPEKPDEKKEGAFYVWTLPELDAILGPEAAHVIAYHFGAKAEGNVDSDPHQQFVGKNILHIAHSLEETAEQFKTTVGDLRSKLSGARQKLFEARQRRPRPHLDDKILVSWNGLMISAFSRAYQVLGDVEYLHAAERAAQFVLTKQLNPKTKELLRRYRDGEARYEAHLEDYAFFAQGLLDLYEASLDIKWLEHAIALTEIQNTLFYDKENGGFFDVSGKDRSILVRTKEWYDGAEPSGNSIAILNLLRISEMINKQEWRAMAEQSLSRFGQRMLDAPEAMPQLLVALDFSLSKPKQIIIAGKADDRGTRELLEEVHSRFIPNKIILLADGGSGQKTLSSYIPFLETVRTIDGKPTAYLCENYACKLPTPDRAVFAQQLDGRRD